MESNDCEAGGLPFFSACSEGKPERMQSRIAMAICDTYRPPVLLSAIQIRDETATRMHLTRSVYPLSE
ncbi:MAG: hypothetical protein QHC90_05510 [Shinella sp.]|nr:hypothetical protein [Shinella sp.]